MTPERWQQVKQVLAAALELGPEERTAYLDRSYAADASLRADIEPLVASGQRLKEEFLGEDDFAAAAGVLQTGEVSWVGRRVGYYKVVEQIGEGGMGEVYRAFRADDQYRKEVALKFVRAGQFGSSVFARFKNERQILAGLDHPNLAKLLDGGATEEGVPYLVMELIEGRPITEYCATKNLPLRQRLQLFLQVCAGVHYAHQHLIIHRDIKPQNILVTTDGIPKLLDFGIAKIVEPDSADALGDPTLTGFRALTPRYASPEQIKGEAMTTATDVYSLGVVLYELLTGLSPYELANVSTEGFSRMVCEKEVQKPSLAVSRAQPASGSRAFREISPEKLRKQLGGDLDNIVLMALRKEPSRRYASVKDLQEDIRRHLKNIPVSARNDTVWYRTHKFVARHTAGVGASVLVILAIVTGLIVTLREARIARVQSARAERRFNDVRKLANSLMFEVHDSIKDLPGAMPARKLLVNRAQEYLDSLSQEASGDAGLQRELAAAYDRIGDLLGYNGGANLGDFSGAMRSYEKALVTREASAAASPHDHQMQFDLLNDYFRLSFVCQDMGDYSEALRHLDKGTALAQRLTSGSPDVVFKDFEAGLHWQTGNVLMAAGQYQRALENYSQGESIREAIAQDAKATPLIQVHLAADYIGLGKALRATGDLNRAVEFFRKGTEIIERQAQADPNNATLQEYLGEAESEEAYALLKRRDLEEANKYYSKALEVFRRLSNADPTNSLARVNAGFLQVDLADVLIEQGQIDRAMAQIRSGIATFEGIEHKNRYEILGQATSYESLGRAHRALAGKDITARRKSKHLREARLWYKKSLSTLQQVTGLGSVDPLGGDITKDSVAQELSMCEEALARLNTH